MSKFVPPCFMGFVEQLKGVEFPAPHRTYTAAITLVARRSVRRIGTRQWRRGADQDASVANFVESEQLVEMDGGAVLASFVQVSAEKALGAWLSIITCSSRLPSLPLSSAWVSGEDQSPREGPRDLLSGFAYLGRWGCIVCRTCAFHMSMCFLCVNQCTASQACVQAIAVLAVWCAGARLHPCAMEPVPQPQVQDPHTHRGARQGRRRLCRPHPQPGGEVQGGAGPCW